MDWSLLIGAVSGIVQGALGVVSTAITAGQQAITERRKIIAYNISELIDMKTTNYKDIIYAALAMVTIVALIYITKSNKK